MTDLAIQGIVLPGVPDPGDPIMQWTLAWLMAQRTRNTMLAYRCDVAGIGTHGGAAKMSVPAWLPWLGQHGVAPLAAKRGHVDTYARLLDTGGYSPATILRKICAISSWYTYLIQEEATEKNPARWATRPAVDQHASSTVGLNEEEARRLIAQADEDSPLASAIIRTLVFGGWRISLVINAVRSDLGHDRGHRTVKVTLKGGKVIKAPLAEPVTVALDAYLKTRGAVSGKDLIFVTPGGHQLNGAYLWRMIRSTARRARVPSWDQLSPHSLRHTFATLSFDYGVPLADVQDAMGHTDPATTRRYDRARHRLDRHPTHVLAQRLTAPVSETQ